MSKRKALQIVVVLVIGLLILPWLLKRDAIAPREVEPANQGKFLTGFFAPSVFVCEYACAAIHGKMTKGTYQELNTRIWGSRSTSHRAGCAVGGLIVAVLLAFGLVILGEKNLDGKL